MKPRGVLGDLVLSARFAPMESFVEPIRRKMPGGSGLERRIVQLVTANGHMTDSSRGWPRAVGRPRSCVDSPTSNYARALDYGNFRVCIDVASNWLPGAQLTINRLLGIVALLEASERGCQPPLQAHSVLETGTPSGPSCIRGGWKERRKLSGLV
jgi:hypothetical protein